MKFKTTPVVLAALLLVTAAGCSRKNGTPAAASKEAAGRRTIYVAHTQTYVPYVFVDDAGKSDGFEVAVWKEIAAMYPQYDIQFVPTSDDDLLIGVQTGKYAVGVKGAWSTDERRAKYLFPQNYLAASVIGLTFRTENADKIRDLESFAQFSGKLVPISPQSAQYSIITDFNKAHPGTQIKLVPSDVFNIPESYTWVLEKRYDGFFDLQVAYKRNVLAPDGAYHQFADKLSYVVYKAIPTWPLFNKNETQLAADYDAAVTALHANGKYTELAEKYFGEDVSKYVQK
jgi:ABC-type amino acid transport/signal transduction systems, periplasmic component/domain